MSTRHNMVCDVKIEDFEGPLDLLLHLIKENNIDIINIDVELITNQYLSYINKMEELNINVASVYLVMASELILLKSRSLLPMVKEEPEKEELTKEKLIDRLTQYKKYKEVSAQLLELANRRKEIYIKLPENKEKYTTEVINSAQSIENLFKAFNSFLERNRQNKPLNTRVTTKEYSVRERCLEIRKILNNNNGEISFISLFETFEKEMVIVTFLSVLEMVKKQEIIINQSHNFEEIKIELRKSDNNE